MNGQDPERRIADLEQQLTMQKRGTGQPAAGPQNAATSRRFVASADPPTTKQMMKYTYVAIAVGMASLGAIYMALFMVGTLLNSPTVWQVGGFVVFVGFLLLGFPAYAAFQRRINRDKTVLVDIGSDGLTVSTRPGETFPFSDAQLGRWTLAGYAAMTKGTALHLRSGRHRVVLGGRDHRITTGTPLPAAPVDGVDAWLWAPEFDDLLTMVARPGGLDVRAPAPGQPTRCLLIPNPARLFSSSVFGMFKNTATALSLNANPPQPGLAIDVGEDAISVIDVNSNAQIASAAVGQVTATPAGSTRSMPYTGTLTTPVLVVSVPNSQPLTIGCPDFAGPATATWSGKTKLTYRFAWHGLVHSVEEPAFVVSDADWLTLVEKFGLAPHLEDKARTESDGNPHGLAPATHNSAVTAATTAPLARPKRKLWIYAIAFAVLMFVAAPVMMWVASSVQGSHQNKDDAVKADRLRPFMLPFTGLRLPHGVAVDAAGNVYVAETRTSQILKLAAGSNAQTVLPFTGLNLADPESIDTSNASLAVDGAGNVYVTDSENNRVVELAAGSNTQTVLPFGGLDAPEGVAVDTAGTVYVSDFSNGRVLKLTAGSSTPTVLPSLGRAGSEGGDVAVDVNGNVYTSATEDCGAHCSRFILLKLAPGSDTWTKLPDANDKQGVAVDPGGNVYAFQSGDNRGSVMKLAAGSQSWTELPGQPPFIDPLGLAVDTHGNVYVTDHLGSRAVGGGSWFGIWHGKDDAQGFVVKLPAG